MNNLEDNNTIDSLQESLQQALLEKPINISKILDLATEIAKSDPDNVRFFADAGLIQRLGYELVSRQETAVAELVKNAYDADARIVDLIFLNTEQPGGSLEIRDNGTGMSRIDLIDGFMRLSSMIKLRNPTSPRFNRIRAGRKGIGRFAVQRLGRKLTIRTKVKDSHKALQIIIDWDQFTSGKDLSSIANRIHEVEASQPEGTTLIIDNLRDSWTDAEMRRVWRYIADLIQPFPLSKVPLRSDIDPGFRADIYKQSGNNLLPIADQQTLIFDYAIAEITAAVDEYGRGQWSIISKPFPQINESLPIGSDPDNPSIKFHSLRNIRFKAYYYIYQSGLLPPMMDSVIRNIADEHGGIRLYRNGFRVPTYGIENDWLGLDNASSRRVILAPIGNINFLGFFEVNDLEGVQFEETASREGLIENESFKEMVYLGYRILRASVLKIAEARHKKGLSSGRGDQLESPPEDKVRQALNDLQQMVTIEAPTYDQVFHSAVRESVKILKQNFEQYTENMVDELGMMRVLASLGLVVGEFTHEVKGTLTAASMNAQNLNDDPNIPHTTKEIIHKLKGQLDRANAYAQYFDRTVSENANRDRLPRDLRYIIKTFIDEHKKSAAQKSITISDEIVGYQLLTSPMHGSEIDSIIFNFYSNSIKAIRRKRIDGKILIRAGRTNDRVFFEFADNGIGIPSSYKDRIFNAFFTTSTLGRGDDDDLKGSGLGLKIVKDIVTTYGGEVFLTIPPDDFTTCFRVELPAKLDDEE